MEEGTSPASRLLRAWGRGDLQARDELVPVVYRELRRRAGAYVRRERHDHTLQPTALVHEAYVRLMGQERVAWQALVELARIDPRQGQIMELRYFGGLSEQEVAAVLSISRATVTREWHTARAWLYRRMAVGRTRGPS